MHALVLHVIYHPNKHLVVMPLVCQGRCIHYILFTTASNVPAQVAVLINYWGCTQISARLQWLRMQLRDFYHCKGQLTNSFSDKNPIYSKSIYMYSHTGTVYSDKSDGPSCQSCGRSTMIDWFHSVAPHHQSEKLPSSILIFLYFIYIHVLIHIHYWLHRAD